MKKLPFLYLLTVLAIVALFGCDDDSDSTAEEDQADDDDNDNDNDDSTDDDNDSADDDDNDDSVADDDDDNDNDDSTDDDTSIEPEREWFFDAQGRVALYHGVQIIQQRDPYISWHTEADYDRLVEWGFNSIRLGIVWAAVEPEPGVYNETFLEQLDERIAWCRERGIAVILDMHQDLYGEKFNGDGAPAWATEDNGLTYVPWEPWYLNYLQPALVAAFNNFWRNRNGVQDAYVAMWSHLAKRYADEPAVLGYDLMNEPFFGTYLPLFVFDRFALEPFYRNLATAMRTDDEDAWFFVEPAGAVGAGLPCHLGLPDVPNVSYGPHLYPFVSVILSVYLGLPLEIEFVLDAIDRTARRMAAPVWVGEWALFNGQTVNHEQYMRDATRLLDEHLASWSYWVYNKDDNVGLLDPDGNERAWVLDAVSRPYPQKTAGYPESFAFDPDAGIFTLVWTENPVATGPTEIYIPRRHFPGGFILTCSDPDGEWSYTWNEARQVASIEANRQIARHSVMIETMK